MNKFNTPLFDFSERLSDLNNLSPKVEYYGVYLGKVCVGQRRFAHPMMRCSGYLNEFLAKVTH